MSSLQRIVRLVLLSEAKSDPRLRTIALIKYIVWALGETPYKDTDQASKLLRSALSFDERSGVNDNYTKLVATFGSKREAAYKKMKEALLRSSTRWPARAFDFTNKTYHDGIAIPKHVAHAILTQSELSKKSPEEERGTIKEESLRAQIGRLASKDSNLEAVGSLMTSILDGCDRLSGLDKTVEVVTGALSTIVASIMPEDESEDDWPEEMYEGEEREEGDFLSDIDDEPVASPGQINVAANPTQRIDDIPPANDENVKTLTKMKEDVDQLASEIARMDLFLDKETSSVVSDMLSEIRDEINSAIES